jgi:uncharacterized protein (DUF488 family)
MDRVVYTLGHSTHPLARFLELLRAHEISAVADLRSAPYSRRNPHFSREALQASLHERGVAYLFLGRELGGRPSNPSCWRDDRVDYARLAATGGFRAGLDRVEELIATSRAALLCAEGDPLRCHRAIVVARELARRGVAIRHILPDAMVERHEESELRLLRSLGLAQGNLFGPDRDLVARAYELQGRRIGAGGGAPRPERRSLV